MKDQLFAIFESAGKLTTQQVAVNIIMAAVLGLLIYISYAVTHNGTIYSKKFNASLVVLATLTGTVMTVIGNNIALSLGMVGALSIVRFRTAIKDSRDTVYIFWAIIVGICCGVSDYRVAAIGSIVTFVVLMIFGMVKNDNRVLVIIRAARSNQEEIQSKVFKFFDQKAILRVRNTTDSTVEFIYEITSKMLKDSEARHGNIVEQFYQLGGVEYVNTVMQNDEVSN